MALVLAFPTLVLNLNSTRNQKKIYSFFLMISDIILIHEIPSTNCTMLTQLVQFSMW